MSENTDNGEKKNMTSQLVQQANELQRKERRCAIFASLRCPHIIYMIIPQIIQNILFQYLILFNHWCIHIYKQTKYDPFNFILLKHIHIKGANFRTRHRLNSTNIMYFIKYRVVFIYFNIIAATYIITHYKHMVFCK